VKFLQQTNHAIGADAATGEFAVTIRYAFNAQTAKHLERWWWLASNPNTGGVGMTSVVKTDGHFYWLVPNISQQANLDSQAQVDTYKFLRAYYLEGVLCTGLTPGPANMNEAGLAVYNLSLTIDRFYPKDPNDLIVQTGNVPGTVARLAQIVSPAG